MAPKKIGVSACGNILSPSLILTCSFVVERDLKDNKLIFLCIT